MKDKLQGNLFIHSKISINGEKININYNKITIQLFKTLKYNYYI